MIRILFSGSRFHSGPALIAARLDQAAGGHEQVTLVHGRCDPRVRIADGRIVRVDWDVACVQPWRGPYLGADWHAHFHAVARGWTVEPHPARWRVHGEAAGPVRNQHMVGLGADVCVAAPLGDSPGTRDAMRRARRAGIPVIDISLPAEAEGLW